MTVIGLDSFFIVIQGNEKVNTFMLTAAKKRDITK